MNLSSELASQFAKITNDVKPKKNEEVTLYGEVYEYEDRICVKFDGSEELTPVTTVIEKDESGNITNYKYGAASVKTGDRVSVSLKNHSATITGNMSDPPAGRAELLVTEDSIIARVGELSELIVAQDEIIAKMGENVSLRLTELGVQINGVTTFTNNLADGLENGTTVINGGCIQTGRIDAQYLNLTGAITFNDLDTQVTDSINDANNAAGRAIDIANGAVSDASDAMDVAASAKRIAQSISIPDYIQETYIDSVRIKSPTIEGNEMIVYGSFQTKGYTDQGVVTTGYMGAAMGKDADGNSTYGVALGTDLSYGNLLTSNYVIVTNGGVRLETGWNSVTVTPNGIHLTCTSGKAYYNGAEIATK